MGDLVQVDFGKRDADPATKEITQGTKDVTKAPDLPEQAHLSGEAVCIACQHTWVAVAPVGVTSGLECPECSLGRGGFKYDVGLKEGSGLFECRCGSDQFHIVAPGRDDAGQLFKINMIRPKASQLLRVCASCGQEGHMTDQ